MKYEICADEAWTHNSAPLNRYWCFYGGAFGLESDIDRLETALRLVRTVRGFAGEVKWANLSAENVSYYNDLLDIFFDHLVNHDLHYRQFFISREHVAVPDHEGAAADTLLDVQFKLYYQFLKHSFGLQHLPAATAAEPHQVLLRLDEHSSSKHKTRLKNFVEGLHGHLTPTRDDLSIRVTYVQSQSLMRLQLCDLLMGAAGSYGNRKHEFRALGQRGMKPMQRLRFELATRIYKDLRGISCSERGTGAFNWFESTGRSSPSANLTDKVRIWKFLPTRYQLDKGWQNDNLGRGGVYVAPQLSVDVFDARDGR